MFQQISTHPMIDSKLSREPSSIQPSLIEINATRLMDELFGELERTLETSHALSTQLVARECSTLKPRQQPSCDVASLVSPTKELLVSYTPLTKNLISTSSETKFDAITQVGSSAIATERSSWLEQPYPSLFSNRLLFSLACASLVLTVLFWVVSQFQSPKGQILMATLPETSNFQKSIADTQFADYMQRSLARINKQARNDKKPVLPSFSDVQPLPQPTVTALPTGSLPAPAHATQVSPGIVAERIYIPVYRPQPTQVAAVKSPQVAAVKPAQVAAVKPVQANKKLATASSSLASAVPFSAVSNSSQTLVGVLELGDRSMALIEANGAARRIQLGETLDASGWKLMQIADQKVVVQRGQEVRSIYVGQKF
jgi:hypothetical protein